MENSDEKRKGVFTPDEFFKLDLTYAEMFILSIYKYYTEEGNLKCCVYTNQQIADIINANVQTVIRAKKRFKKLGYIRTNGGIRTYYLGINKEQNVQCNEQNEEEEMYEGPIQNVESEPIQNAEGPIQNVESEPIQNAEGPIQNVESEPIQNAEGGLYKMHSADTYNLYAHNKEEKRIKKENNKEIIKNKKRVNKEEMKSELKEKQTVFDRVLDFLNQDKDTKEHIDYIIENYKKEIDEIIKKVEEVVEEGVIPEKSYIKDLIKFKIKNKLFQDNNIKFNKELPKKEKEVNEEKDVSYIDLF